VINGFEVRGGSFAISGDEPFHSQCQSFSRKIDERGKPEQALVRKLHLIGIDNRMQWLLIPGGFATRHPDLAGQLGGRWSIAPGNRSAGGIAPSGWNRGPRIVGWSTAFSGRSCEDSSHSRNAHQKVENVFGWAGNREIQSVEKPCQGTTV
jgi:hypothetical protein